MASMKEVAQQAGVSVATVSHVLRGTKRVSPELTERVRAAAQALGYVTNLQASSLRTGRTQTLGVLLPDLSNPFFVALLHALAPAARAAGKVLMVYEAENDVELEQHGLERMAAGQVDGLIWVPVDVDAPHLAQCSALNLPMVTIDRPLPGTDAVVADHVAGGRLLAQHLMELGHGRVALLTGPTNLPSSRGRRRGFLEAFAPTRPVGEAATGFTHELSPEAQSLLTAGGYTAVVCPNDMVALGAIRQLAAQGLSVPGDVSVVGFDDVAWASLMQPALTTVRQPLAALGSAAVRLLLERLEEPTRTTRGVVMPVELVVRASTGTPTPSAVNARQPLVAGGAARRFREERY